MGVVGGGGYWRVVEGGGCFSFRVAIVVTEVHMLSG